MKQFRCNKCKVDTPCEHQIDKFREDGWNEGREKMAVIDDRLEDYQDFMKVGDFERWQKVCYLDPVSVEWASYNLMALREYLRACWIMQRTVTYQSAGWFHWSNKKQETRKAIRQAEEMLRNRLNWAKHWKDYGAY